MTVEFVGLPGAGKSTIARLLAERLHESGFDCIVSPAFARVGRRSGNGLVGRTLRGAADLVCAIGLSYELRGLWKDLVPRIHQRHIIPRFWRLTRIWAALGRIDLNEEADARDRIVILDQGLLQCLRSIYPHPVTDRLENQLTARAIAGMRSRLPDLVVVVRVDEATAAVRMRSRPYQKSAFDPESPDLEAALSPHRRYVEAVLPPNLAGKVPSVLALDGTVEPARNVDLILNAVADLSAQARPRGECGSSAR